jgi:hypothetical protein
MQAAHAPHSSVCVRHGPPAPIPPLPPLTSLIRIAANKHRHGCSVLSSLPPPRAGTVTHRLRGEGAHTHAPPGLCPLASALTSAPWPLPPGLCPLASALASAPWPVSVTSHRKSLRSVAAPTHSTTQVTCAWRARMRIDSPYTERPRRTLPARALYLRIRPTLAEPPMRPSYHGPYSTPHVHHVHVHVHAHVHVSHAAERGSVCVSPRCAPTARRGREGGLHTHRPPRNRFGQGQVCGRLRRLQLIGHAALAFHEPAALHVLDAAADKVRRHKDQ